MSVEHGGDASPEGSATRDIIVIGASAGGVEALRRLVGGLPSDLPAAVFVVMHIPPQARSILPELLTCAGPLPAAHAQDGEPIRPGRIYVAPPDRHMVLRPGVVRLNAGPRENHSRPAADPLFRSAATAYGPRVIGVVLSGSLTDGTAGLWEIKQRGGIAVVQDPGEAVYPDMPHTAMDQVPVDHVLPAAQIASLLARLASERAGGEALERDPLAPVEAAPARGEQPMAGEEWRPGEEAPGGEAVERDMSAQVTGQRDGTVTVYVCPDCGGSLWQVNAGPIPRFRCHVGHVYGGEDLLQGHTTELDRALWRAIRTQRDRANLTRQLANSAKERGDAETGARFDEAARRDDEHAEALVGMLAAAEPANRSL